PDPVIAGQNLTYSIVASNNGPSNATGVLVTDTLPAGVSFVSATPTQGTFSSATGVWSVGNLNSGASATLTLVVTVNPCTTGSLSNGVAVSGNQPDPTPTNNTDTESTT